MRGRRVATLLAVVVVTALGSCGRNKPAPPQIPIDTMPKVVDNPITYPPEARERRIQGSVVIQALVGKDGRVKEATADTAQAASPILTKAAMAAVRQWTFEPARTKGEPTEIWITVPVHFRLTP